MVTEFDEFVVPTLAVNTDDGYEPTLSAIFDWVISNQATERRTAISRLSQYRLQYLQQIDGSAFVSLEGSSAQNARRARVGRRHHPRCTPTRRSGAVDRPSVGR